MARQVLKKVALLAILMGIPSGIPALANEPANAPALRSNVSKLPDMSKSGIELPVKGIIGDLRMSLSADVKQKTGGALKAPLPKNPAKTVDNSEKPALKQAPSLKVEPGKVRWHKAIQTAMEASSQSGKPVLLFQMMGRLDDRFC